MCSDPELSNKRKYPTFARTYPVAKQLTPSLIALLKNFNWHTVALITATGNKFEETRKHIKKKFDKQNIRISYEASVPTVVDYKHDIWNEKFPRILNEIKSKARSKWQIFM